MKIAFILDLWDPIVGGSQSHVYEIAHRLVKDYGFKVDIFTRAIVYNSKVYDSNEIFHNSNLRIIRIGPATISTNAWGRIATLWTVAWRIFQENKKMEYDLIHAHSILGGVMGKLASLLTKRPVIFTVHGAMNMDKGDKTFDFFVEKWILTQIKYDKLISVAKGFLKYKNINKDIEVIPNGVSIHNYDLVKKEIKADYFKIIFVGRLHWQKGIDTLIEAINLLKDKEEDSLIRKRVQIHLIGYGFDISKYEEMVNRYNLKELIIFRGKIKGEKLIKEYKSSHIFILPSLCEGQPITILEAMASKLPVLTTYAADNAGILNSDSGWKVPENNPQALAEKLSEAINLNEKILEKMGLKGYETVKTNYTMDKLLSKTVSIYKALRLGA